MQIKIKTKYQKIDWSWTKTQCIRGKIASNANLVYKKIEK